MIRRTWKPALWGLFGLNVFVVPILFQGGAGDPALPAWMPTGPGALIAVHAAGVAFALPNTLFCLAAGMFFGLWRGMLIATAGTWLGSLAAFLVGRILLRNRARRLLDRFPRAKLFVSALGRADVRTVVLTRLSPLVPFAAQNFGWAVTPVSFRRYALGSLIAVPVGASFFAHLGAAGRAGASMAVERFSWSAFLTVVGLAATFWLIRWISRIANEALKEELPSD